MSYICHFEFYYYNHSVPQYRQYLSYMNIPHIQILWTKLTIFIQTDRSPEVYYGGIHQQRWQCRNGHDKASGSVNANQMASEALQRAGRELI